MKQSAVEWLQEQLKDVKYNPLEKNGYSIAKERLFNQAKEMEKQQIMESYKDSTCQFSVDSRIDCPKSAEQYYNEKFKNK